MWYSLATAVLAMDEGDRLEEADFLEDGGVVATNATDR